MLAISRHFSCNSVLFCHIICPTTVSCSSYCHIVPVTHMFMKSPSDLWNQVLRFVSYLHSGKQVVGHLDLYPSKAVVESLRVEGNLWFLLPCPQNSSQYLCGSCNWIIWVTDDRFFIFGWTVLLNMLLDQSIKYSLCTIQYVGICVMTVFTKTWVLSYYYYYCYVKHEIWSYILLTSHTVMRNPKMICFDWRVNAE